MLKNITPGKCVYHVPAEHSNACRRYGPEFINELRAEEVGRKYVYTALGKFDIEGNQVSSYGSDWIAFGTREEADEYVEKRSLRSRILSIYLPKVVDEMDTNELKELLSLLERKRK